MQPRFERDMRAFMARAGELGYAAIELNHSMDAQMIGAALAHPVLPIASVHAPAPLERHPERGWNRELNLASLEEAERALAVQYTQRTIEVAAAAGARYAVVHLGGAGTRLLAGERRLRALFDRRAGAGDEWAQAIADAHRERAATATPYLAAAARSLAALAETAARHRVAIGIECRLHHHEIPLPQEAATLLAPYPTTVAGYWHDVGHAEVQHRLGLVDRATWFDLLGARLIGLHLHDVRGIVDHRAPGNGDVDFTWLAAHAPANAARTLEIDQREPDDAVARSIEVLRAAGLLSR